MEVETAITSSLGRSEWNILSTLSRKGPVRASFDLIWSNSEYLKAKPVRLSSIRKRGISSSRWKDAGRACEGPHVRRTPHKELSPER